MPLAALTAWQGLFDHCALDVGPCVLVHAGAGDVGHFAVQFAKHKGAEVFVTASGDEIDFVHPRGAALPCTRQCGSCAQRSHAKAWR